MCTHGLGGDAEHMSSTDINHGHTGSAADAEIGAAAAAAGGPTAQSLSRPCASAHARHFRLSRNGDGTVSAATHTVCERVGERWRDGAGSLAILGIRSLT
jgi:hypothetical protein